MAQFQASASFLLLLRFGCFQRITQFVIAIVVVMLKIESLLKFIMNLNFWTQYRKLKLLCCSFLIQISNNIRVNFIPHDDHFICQYNARTDFSRAQWYSDLFNFARDDFPVKCSQIYLMSGFIQKNLIPNVQV